MIVNYSKIEPCDIIVTGGISLFSYVIRFVTRGFKNRRNRREIPTHVGIVVEFHGQYFIAEMLSDGLNINPLSRYLDSKKRFILDVVRLRNVTPYQKSEIQRRIAVDRRYNLEYDWLGVFSFLNRSAKHSEKKFFCSEYVSYLLREYCSASLSRKPCTISPADFSLSENEIETFAPVKGLRRVNGWRMEE